VPEYKTVILTPRTLSLSRPVIGAAALLALILALAGGTAPPQGGGTGVLLPDGREFVSWERPVEWARTYYVDIRDPHAADTNPGTAELPFLTINKAAQVLQPGERVVIKDGVYRERVDPARGGSGPDRMIGYEAAPGATVVVKGSRPVPSGWEPSVGFKIGPPAGGSKPKVFRRSLEDLDFHGYNPFGMVSIMQDRVYLMPKPEELWRHLRRRGLVYVDGRPLQQVELYQDLARADGAFWCEHNGLAIHVRFPGDTDPGAHEIELAIQEQVFAPRTMGLAYIRVAGIAFEHGANAFPVPQRGLVSMSRGHHWIFENCAFRHANGVALDIGAQDWDMETPALTGFAVVRRCHVDDAGVCGIAGMAIQDTLVEYNLIEHVGDRDVELAWETGGIKFHATKSCLIRSNVIRHTVHAEAIWLDYENANTRVTGNILGDNLETLRGGIYLEASHEPNMIDNNIIWKSTEGAGGGSYNMPGHGGWGITIDGTDETTVAHNLIGLSQDAAIKFRNIESRIVSGRGGTTRRNKVLNNIFYRCGKSIDLSNQDNTVDGNLYTRDWGQVRDETRGVGRGLNWIPDAGTTLQLDLEAWRKYFGFDKNGAYADMAIDMDLDALTMTWSVRGDPAQFPAGRYFARDLLGQPAPGGLRKPGPLVSLPGTPTKVAIDPRR
jgi:hypothetical protein